MWRLSRKKNKAELIEPDEVFLDSHNLPAFNTQQFEGRIEQPLAKRSFLILGLGFLLVAAVYLWRVANLQIVQGKDLSERSANNNLRHTPIFAERGVITDRHGQELAWNDPERHYLPAPGLAHVLGYVGYSAVADLNQGYLPKEYVGKAGVEKTYDERLRGAPGIRIEEVNVRGEVQSDHVLQPSTAGADLTLTIDAGIETELYQSIKSLATSRGFQGGAGVLLDVVTGEIIALTSFPEYDPNVLAAGQATGTISAYQRDPRHPFVNRAVAGLYTPGSIIKPYLAIGALAEAVISPTKQILSTGALTVPNPYDPEHPSVFKDWKAHGWVDMRRALAVSSNVYFYNVGGGFGSQRGLGIANIDKYTKLFGFGQKTGIDLEGELAGVVPTPAWKEANFPGEPWRLGDTYHTAIGQYGFQVTPLEMARAVAAIATDGKLVTPRIIANPLEVAPPQTILVAKEHFAVVKEGLRLGTLEGTARALNVPYVEIAAKSGTAELGVSKERVNSWITGFFPYANPRYAFAVVMEKGERANIIGSAYVMRELLDWMSTHTPEYFK